MTFKKGDKIKPKQTHEHPLDWPEKNILTFDKYINFPENCFRVQENSDLYNKNLWELASPEPTNEELLELLNKGQGARDELINRKVSLEFSRSDEDWKDCHKIGVKYRIKKKEFTPITINKNLNVRFDNDKFMIGCTEFNPKFLYDDLCLLLYNRACIGVTYKALRVYRDGLHHTGVVVSWGDVEKVYKALEEYLE